MNAVLDSIPGFDFVWQFVTLGAFVGGLLAYRRQRRDPAVDPFELMVRWSAFGLALGLAIVALAEVAQ